jgi:hypothetical protein
MSKHAGLQQMLRVWHRDSGLHRPRPAIDFISDVGEATGENVTWIGVDRNRNLVADSYGREVTLEDIGNYPYFVKIYHRHKRLPAADCSAESQVAPHQSASNGRSQRKIRERGVRSRPGETIRIFRRHQQTQCFAGGSIVGDRGIILRSRFENILERRNFLFVETLLAIQILPSDRLKRTGLKKFGFGLAELDAAEDCKRLTRCDRLAGLGNKLDYTRGNPRGNFGYGSGIRFDTRSRSLPTPVCV